MSVQRRREPELILLRTRLIGKEPRGAREEQDWLVAASGVCEAWSQRLARWAGGEARWSDSDPSLASLARPAMGSGSAAPWLCEWSASEAALAVGDNPEGGQSALDGVVERALLSLSPALFERLPGRWSDRLLERVSGGVDWELAAWRSLRARWEREELEAFAPKAEWDGEERRSRGRGGL